MAENKKRREREILKAAREKEGLPSNKQQLAGSCLLNRNDENQKSVECHFLRE